MRTLVRVEPFAPVCRPVLKVLRERVTRPCTRLIVETEFESATIAHIVRGRTESHGVGRAAKVTPWWRPRADASKPALIIAVPSIPTTEQPYDAADLACSGGTHGCYYSRRSDQEALSRSSGPPGPRAHPPPLAGYHRHGSVCGDRQLR